MRKQRKDTEGLRRFEEELRDELNVKEVKYLEGGAGVVEYRFKPNLKLVGKKYGKLVPALKTSLKSLVGQEAAEAHDRLKQRSRSMLQSMASK